MKPAPLQLVDYYLTSLHFDANPNYEPETAEAFDLKTLHITPEVRQTEDLEEKGTKWFVSLQIKQEIPDGQNIPYSFALQIQGVVLVSPYLTGSTLDRAVHANGPALLFGAAREIIRAATGRGPWAPVIIPSTNFLAGLPPKKSPPRKKAKKSAKKKRTQKK